MPLPQHESPDLVPPPVKDQKRALASLIEELEAVAWYQERASVTQDATIRAVLEHNRDEEIEHACMLLEWLRRNFPGFEEQLKTYLFTTAPITEIEEAGEGEQSPASKSSSDGSLNIGSMKKKGQ
jgi:uncharacterized protein